MSTTPRAAGTRLALIETAERLYAERGVHGVSLREIGAAAGQRNTGAVRYHFGSKEALLTAVFTHRMTEADAERRRLLAEADAEGRGDSPDALVAAFVLPLAKLLGDADRPTWYVRFLVRATADQEVGAAVRYGQGSTWTAGAEELERRVLKLLMRLPESLRYERWRLLISFTVHALADREAQLATGDADLTPRDQFVGHVLSLGAAMLRAD
ncbi:TetR/AcrR family transcriptional regulator [Streptomyces endophyticus]|uniref:TetR/AcrR family transcriptional regulator n=1 Tax=Streptomyces endophyticus TaxID=714166 RepID=A0ABU6FJ62_9ACTN|nr:helix-turn-helix domain-containing protein [Streptomyces endophyticus]MEB8344096.1 TetR/AcrR family transcriptional regulator [Streptomyces endophyticus]